VIKLIRYSREEGFIKPQGIKFRDGNFAVHGYSTEKDIQRAIKDLERLLTVLSMTSLYEVNKILEPYRAKGAKMLDKELGL
jgi:hypothetical protein